MTGVPGILPDEVNDDVPSLDLLAVDLDRHVEVQAPGQKIASCDPPPRLRGA